MSEKKITYNMRFVRETRCCLVFQLGSRETDDFVTLYVRKSDAVAAGLDPRGGVNVTVEEAHNDD